MTASTRVTHGLLVLVLLALLTVIGMLAAGVGGGPLDPQQAPGPTLSQIEPRSPIPPVGWNGSFPIVINQSGSYYLTRNLIGVSGQHGITISASHVEFDLNGFQLRGVPGSLDGVGVPGVTQTNLRVLNGTITAWGGDGIDFEFDGPAAISDVIVSLSANGMRLGNNSTVDRCTVGENSQVGIFAPSGGGNVIAHCLVYGNGTQGIRLDSFENRVTENHVLFNGLNGNCCTGIWLNGGSNIVEANTAQRNKNYGIWMEGSNNTIVRNIAGENLVGDYNLDGCIGCDIGPIGAAVGATNPWANIDY